MTPPRPPHPRGVGTNTGQCLDTALRMKKYVEGAERKGARRASARARRAGRWD
ncbi:hypothetical protein [Mycobacterium helveticum]|uniref:hypothetical protein n=1 Tax=Mycobacterium helveticum TaxID=2592811 RepID=UPI00143CC960|nr:hypothetical protein [Mycobacterium helveticum]